MPVPFPRADLLEASRMVPVVSGNRSCASDCYESRAHICLKISECENEGRPAFTPIWKERPEGNRRAAIGCVVSLCDAPILQKRVFVRMARTQRPPDAIFRCSISPP